MIWIDLDKLEFMLTVASLKWPTRLHAFCLRVFTKPLKTAPFLCKHRLEVNSKQRGVDTLRAYLHWEARGTAKCPGCPFFIEMEFFFLISWRLIILQYYSGFCHTLKWISHGFTCVPPPPDPSGSSQCTRPEHLSQVSNLGWWSVSP